jgi:hypothetical protein
MIHVNLVDDTTKVKHIEFCVVPVTTKRDFTCQPDDALPLRTVVRLSRRVEAGRTFGRVGKYIWYRLIVTPPSTRSAKCPSSLTYRTTPV